MVDVTPGVLVRAHAGGQLVCDLQVGQTARYYERQKSGTLIHPDNKKLGRFDRISHPIIGDRNG